VDFAIAVFTLICLQVAVLVKTQSSTVMAASDEVAVISVYSQPGGEVK
jgi:hypothetical protein